MIDAIILLIAATLAALGSPGPAPLALAATGARFGVARGIPFLLGVLIGLGCVGLLSALGVSALLARGGVLVSALFVLAIIYFLYIAFKIATAPISATQSDDARNVPGLGDGFVLNILNPKAYAAFAALFAGFALPIEPVSLSIAITGAVIFVVATFIDIAWLVVGGALAPVFASQRYGRPLRISLGLMLGAVAIAAIIAWFL